VRELEEMVPTMADRDDRTRRPARPPLRASTRRRWLIAGGLSGLWLLLLAGTGSMILATIVLVLLTLLAGACVAGLRSLGIDGSHPWIQRMAERPWRDGQEVLQQGLRHLPEVFLVTPSGALLAPNAVELHMNPDDLASLTGMMDLELINISAAEVYQDHIAEARARLGSAGPVEVSVVGDLDVPAGRYRIRQGRPVSAGLPARAGGQPGGLAPPAPYPAAAGARQAVPAGYAAPGAARPAGGGRPPVGGYPAAGGYGPAAPPDFNGHDGRTQREHVGMRTATTGLLTEAPAIPVLRLVTNGAVAETHAKVAHAGRGAEAELVLPAEPTVSRIHAKFVYDGGRWWITSLGRNGITVNGTPVPSECALGDGDAISWGRGSGALVSQVRIG
jgi:hypothetical protein